MIPVFCLSLILTLVQVNDASMHPPKLPTPCPFVDEGYDVCWRLSDDTHIVEYDPVTKNKTLLDYTLNWKMNDTHVRFKASSNSFGWQGIGWSRDGRMESGDAHPYDNPNGTFGDLILMFVANQQGYIYDCYAHERMARKDAQQDVHLISYRRQNARLTFEFSRKKFTGDIHRDYNFTEDDLPMAMWAASEKLPIDFTLESQDSFITSHTYMEYYPLNESGWKRTDIVKNQVISLAAVVLVGLGFVLTIIGIVIGTKLKAKRGNGYSSASPIVQRSSSLVPHQKLSSYAPLSPEGHNEIELSISGSDTD